MNLKEILSISGKPGLYKVVAQSGRGFIVESIEDTKNRFPVNSSHQVALLEEITIYTESDENIPLKELLSRFRKHEDEGNKLPDPKEDSRSLRSFFTEMAPEHDEERVYASDMKKILKWYELLKTSGYATAEDEAEAEKEENTGTSEE